MPNDTFANENGSIVSKTQLTPRKILARRDALAEHIGKMTEQLNAMNLFITENNIGYEQ